ncbi:MAG: InlB B-repeat-containing protein [Velocimicrobium sp.]
MELKVTERLFKALFREKAKRVMAVLLTVLMVIVSIDYGGIIRVHAQSQSGNTYDISAGDITINSSNLDTYNYAVITGASESNMITIDGVTAYLTLSGMNLNIKSVDDTIARWHSAIKLTNDATLNLTITGDNTVTGGDKHAAINVPAGCSLVITQDSTGTLTAKAGNCSAGIGADCDQTENSDIMTVGNITIDGGTVKAYGNAEGAGIGGTLSGKTGNIIINGGTVYAKGGGGLLVKPFYQSICGAGIGGGGDGYVEKITITGGNVIAIGGHYHVNGLNMRDYPGAGIGCGSLTGVTSDEKYTCGTIRITGGTVSATGGNNNAVNAIGYGLSPNFDISGDKYIGSITISDSASVNTNGGAIHPLSNNVNTNMYKLAMTIYDGRLTKAIEGATIKVNGKTYLGDIKVNENYVGTISCSFLYNGVLTGEQTVELSAGGYSWNKTVNFKENNFDYIAAIGSKLYPVYLWFYDAAIPSDISGVSLSVKQNDNVLNSDSAEGILQLIYDKTITKYKDGVWKMAAYMPAGASELTAMVPGVNEGKAITVSGKTINASEGGTVIILWDTDGKTPFSDTLDLSYGNITFADNEGKVNITYTPENGGTATTAIRQYYQNEYEIIQSNNTATTNQIIFQNTTDVVNVKLNGVNMKSTGKAIDLQNAKAKLNLGGTNAIDCGGGKYEIGIHAAAGSELTIDGNGSLEVKNPSEYGVGIGGYYDYKNGIKEGTGIIRIQGGTLTVSGRYGAAIGSCYQYAGADFGSIYISGGFINASVGGWGAAIGGSANAKPSNVYISDGTVLAIQNGGFGSCIGSGHTGSAGGKVVISGGYVEATATSEYTTAIGGGYCGACASITISGGTVKATGKVASIGTAQYGFGGSLKITGGTISTINNEKPTINLTPTNDGTTPVYYTTVNVDEIYGKDASVNNASVTGYDYGFTDVKTDVNGVLHLYLPESAVDTKTEASFNHVNYRGNITSGDSNVLKIPAVFTVGADTISGTGASLHAAYEGSGSVYYVTSSTELNTGSEVENASGVQSMTMSDGIASTILSGLKENTKYTYYLVVKTGEVYSSVVSVTFTTKKSSNLQSVGTVDGKQYDDAPISHSAAKGDLFTWDSEGTISFTYFIDNNGTKTTAANSGAISEGAAPKYIGTYYLKATLSENGEYAGAQTEYIPFTIKSQLSGTGTQADPYIIETADDLLYVANLVTEGQNFSGQYFRLNNDITYSLVPIGCYLEGSSTNSPFCGKFDGAGHTVTLAMTNDSSGVKQAVALFGYLGSGAALENINTTGTITSSEKFSGGIAGVARDGAVNISNCSSNVEMNFTPGGDATYGGIVGLIDSSGNVTMTNCCFTGKITTSSSKGLEGVGGLCGWKSDTLNAVNCYYNKEKILTEDSSTTSTGNEAVTNDFTSGKIAWLLQNGQSDQAVLVWGQTLSGDTKDSNPVLSSASAKAVHKVRYYQEDKELEDIRGYVNRSMTLPTITLTEEEKNQGYGYSFEITSGNAALDTAHNQLKDISGDVTVTVKKGILYTINTQTNNAALGTAGEGGTYAAGTTVTLTATPRMGCKFERWTSDAEGKTEVSTEKNLTITVNNSSTYYAWFSNDKYMLTVGYFNSEAGTVSGVKEEGYSYNEEATLAAQAKTAYAFEGWKNEYGVTVATSCAISFKVSGNMTITPIFRQISESTTYYSVAFYHQSGNLLKSEMVEANSTITPPTTPSKTGYHFNGWSMDGINPVELNQDGSITITFDMIFKPLFMAKEEPFSFTVNGTETAYKPLSSVIAQVAKTDIPEGKQFAYWKDEDGKIVSYSNPYQFTITGDIVLTAEYEDSIKDVIKEPTLTLSAPTYELVSAGKHKMIWYAAMDLPDGYTLVESGILRVVSTTPQTNGQMTFDTEGIFRRIIQVSSSIPNQYYYSVAATDGKGVSVKAYVVVRNKDGNLETIFSDVQYGCFSGNE